MRWPNAERTDTPCQNHFESSSALYPRPTTTRPNQWLINKDCVDVRVCMSFDGASSHVLLPTVRNCRVHQTHWLYTNLDICEKLSARRMLAVDRNRVCVCARLASSSSSSWVTHNAAKWMFVGRLIKFKVANFVCIGVTPRVHRTHRRRHQIGERISITTIASSADLVPDAHTPSVSVGSGIHALVVTTWGVTGSIVYKTLVHVLRFVFRLFNTRRAFANAASLFTCTIRPSGTVGVYSHIK